MKALIVCLIACVAGVLTGCKLDGPLTEAPTRLIDQALVGHWFSLEDGSPLDVYRISETELLVISEGSPYICTHSDLHGIAFVSCRQIEEGSYYGKFAYMAYRIEGNELRFSPVDFERLGLNENPESAVEVRAALERLAKTPDELRKHLKKEAVFKRKS